MRLEYNLTTNEITEHPDAPPGVDVVYIPQVVSMRQARLALAKSGLLGTVNTAIKNGTEEDQITWEYATEVQRTDSLVTNLGAALGLTPEQLDGLFQLASTL